MMKYLKTETDKKLYSLLKEIWDDNNFLEGISTLLTDDKQKQILIDEIQNGLKDIKIIMYMASDIADGLEV
ncbi:hypothetical protein IKE67_08985 [bacterium]|nr:hypothetical protein [bacterium]